MKSITIKKLFLSLLTIAIGITTLCALNLPIFTANNVSECGFSLLDFNMREEDYILNKWLTIIMGISANLQLLIGLATIIIPIVCFFILPERQSISASKIPIILCVIMNVIYSVEGILYSITLKKFFTELKYELYTSAYIGLIIIVLFLIFYIIFYYTIKDNKVINMNTLKKLFSNNELAIANYQPSNTGSAKILPKTNSTTDKIKQFDKMAELLNGYKVMVDNNIITQEEFEQKKKDLLDKYINN